MCIKLNIYPLYKNLSKIETKINILDLVKNADCFDEHYTPKHLSEYIWNINFSENYIKEELGKIVSVLSRSDIEKFISDCVKECQRKLKTEELSIFILPLLRNEITEVYFKFMNGIMASTPYKNIMIVFINTHDKNWKNYLKIAIFHEYTHCIRLNYFDPYSEEPNLIEYVIREGIGDVFVYKNLGKKSVWVEYSEGKEKNFYKTVIDNSNSKNRQLIMSILFGTNKIPKWTGYVIGFKIVKSFIESNNYTFDDIVKMSANEILRLSNLKDVAIH